LRFEIAITEYWHILKKRKQYVILSGILPGLLGMAFYHFFALLPSALLNPPKMLTAGIIGLTGGIVLGLILIPIIESFSTSFGAIETVEDAIDVRVMGVIPIAETREIISYLKARSPGKANRSPLGNIIDLATHYAPNAPISEGFRVLRTNILSGEKENRIKAIVMTSASPGEGRTLASVNLAISLAQAGLKILLVEADLRRPAFARIFGIEELTGLTDIVLGNFPWRDTVKGITDIIMGKMAMDDVMLTPGLDNLHIITCGGRPPNPAEMIGSRGFDDFLKEARKEYDFIILDSTPVLTTADAAILGGKADAVLILYRIGASSRNLLKSAAGRLEQARCNLAGVILNGTKPEIDTDPGYDREEHHKGLLSFFFRKRVKNEECQPKQGRGKLSTLFRGAIVLGTVILIALTALYLSKTHLNEQKSGVVKKTAKQIKAAAAPVKPKEGPAAVKEPAAPQTQSREQKALIQQPAKPEESYKNIAVSESAYQPGAFPFSVYLGSFRTRGKAEETVTINRQQGIDGFWVKVKFEDIGTWYRIYAGWFKDRARAESFIDEHAIKDAEIKETAYANFIGNFKTLDNLNAKVQSLKDLGYSSYFIKDANGSYNLLSGGFMTTAGAEEQNRELKSDGIESIVVSR
jgi:Mrp family chromosome partitioning ATPase/cell division septation protein DedD